MERDHPFFHERTKYLIRSALMVMNSDQAVDLANELKIPVYIVTRQDKGYTVSYSETFTPLLEINELIEVQ